VVEGKVGLVGTATIRARMAVIARLQPSQVVPKLVMGRAKKKQGDERCWQIAARWWTKD
jgi:hypothetical protein